MNAIVQVDDDGNVSFLDSATEQPLDSEWVELAKKQSADTIKKLVSDQVEKINAGLDGLGALHTFSPPPVDPKYEKVAFDLPRPPQPVEKEVGMLAGLFASKRAAIDKANVEAREAWEVEVRRWEQLRASHEARE